MKKVYIILFLIVVLIIKECVITHSKVLYIPAIKMHLKITSNYLTDISYLYLSHNENFGDNYIKFISKSKKMPDLHIHIVNTKTIEIYTKLSSPIKKLKSSDNFKYVKNDSLLLSRNQKKPLIMVYGRGRIVVFFNKAKVDGDIIE